MIKIIGALDKRGSQLSYALRFNSISNFLACISSFEIMQSSEISAFLDEKLSKSVKFQEVECTEISRSGMYRNFRGAAF